MNNKNRFYFLLLALFATPISAGTPSKKKLYNEIIVKQQKLHDLGEEIMQHAQNMYDAMVKLHEHVEKYSEFTKTTPKNLMHDEIIGELKAFCQRYLENTDTKDLLMREFKGQDPIMGMLKFYFLHNFCCEAIVLFILLEQWEELAQEIKLLLKQTDNLATK